MQRPQRPAVLAVQVERLRLPHRVVTVDEGPGLHVGIYLLDAREAIGNQLGRGHAAFPDVGRCLGKGECAQAHAIGSPVSGQAHRGRYR